MATADRNFKEEDYLAYRGKNFVFRFKGKYLIHDADIRYAWEHRAIEGEEGYSKQWDINGDNVVLSVQKIQKSV